MIRLKNLKAKIEGKTLFEIKDFTFIDGKKYILTGKNGAGKSTLLKSFLGLNDLVKGEIISDKNIIYQAQDPYIFKKNSKR